MTGLSRRRLLQGSAAVAGGAALGAGPFQNFVAHAAPSHKGGGRKPDYGPLAPVPDAADNEYRLSLPAGFQYRSFHQAGTPLGDAAGSPTPIRSDGMAAFVGPRGSYVLVRNHEVNGPVGAFGDPALAYDPMTGGGTTTFRVSKFGEVISARISLNGTQMNCAGGRTLWRSWLTCEETVNGPDVGNDFSGGDNSKLTKQHGYVFEVPVDGQSRRTPIKAAGRFAHEAAAVDPITGAIYLTEDNFNFASGFYRYLPPRHPLWTGRVLDGGELQMLRVVDQPNAELAGPQAPGASYRCDWVTIADPDPTFAAGTTNDQASVTVSSQGLALGAARFARLEGAYYDHGTVYFVSTQGGALAAGDTAPAGYGDGRGQVWAYDIWRKRLRLVYESPGSSTLDLPDNAVTSRSGALVLCEDNTAPNFLRGLTTDGELFDFCENVAPGQTGEEFAGVTFGPDFHTMFVNMQSNNSRTFAIWGPWHAGPFG